MLLWNLTKLDLKQITNACIERQYQWIEKPNCITYNRSINISVIDPMEIVFIIFWKKYTLLSLQKIRIQ